MIFHSNNLIVSFSFSKRPKSRLGGFRRNRSTLESCSQTDNSNTTDKKYLVTSYIKFFFLCLYELQLEGRPECTHSDPFGATGKTCHYEKVKFI